MQTETNSSPSIGSIAPLAKKLEEISVPVSALITIGVPLVFGTVVPIARNWQFEFAVRGWQIKRCAARKIAVMNLGLLINL